MTKTSGDTRQVSVKKADDELQVVYGEVYAPNFPDSQGDFMTEETIRVMAWGFLKKGNVTKIDIQHNQIEAGCFVVESFIARKGDDTFIPGSWVIGVHIPHPELWKLIKDGELNGFSFDGYAMRVETEISIDLPELLKGETDEVAGHHHGFVAVYDADGNFITGRTTKAADGHDHEIIGGTVTEYAGVGDARHRHKFSFVEGILDAQVDNNGE